MILDSKNNKLGTADPIQQLKLLNLKCKDIAPELYRMYAMYLQILRSILLPSVRNAIITLIQSQDNEAIDLQNLTDLKPFKSVIDDLVAKSTSLITVEHLIDLSSQIDKENKLLIKKARHDLSDKSIKSADFGINYSDSKSEKSDISLDFYPPIANPSQIDSWFIPEYLDEDNTLASQYDNNLIDSGEDFSTLDSQQTSPNETNENQESDFNENHKLDLLQSLFSLASQAIQSTDKKEHITNDEPFPESVYESNSKRDEMFLPDNPHSLAGWINSFELAISRRLRNLSHAINVELLKVGLVNSIVPATALDAVVNGQVQNQSNHSNILRISLPANTSLFGESLDISCILLRLSELEFDDPRLRKCRVELRQYEKLIRDMVRKQRYWQSRSLAHKLQEDWWQTSPQKTSTN